MESFQMLICHLWSLGGEKAVAMIFMNMRHVIISFSNAIISYGPLSLSSAL